MARIPEEEIERLKREISLERLAEARGVKLKRHGAELMGQCPFHDDRTPSLVISPEKNLQGSVQARGRFRLLPAAIGADGRRLCPKIAN